MLKQATDNHIMQELFQVMIVQALPHNGNEVSFYYSL